MKCKLFGDTQAVPWNELGVKMPFAPLHLLAQKYKNNLIRTPFFPYCLALATDQDLMRTFELHQKLDSHARNKLLNRITQRAHNTIAALDQCTSDTICINLGGGMHHAGKTPDTGYAYSLINDIIWAVDYQLKKDPDINIGIIDLDFHFGGGTWEYYKHNSKIALTDHYHSRGILYKHQNVVQLRTMSPGYQCKRSPGAIYHPLSKHLINLGADIWEKDVLFGPIAKNSKNKVLSIWKAYINLYIHTETPIAITLGGGYGEDCLELYDELIQWIKAL